MKKLNIQIVKKVNETDKKLASFEWQFLNSSIGTSDLKLIRDMGIETYAELECIDERAAAQTLLTGRIRVELSYPGGGFDYLEEADIEKILKENNGLVILDPHRSCGWGKLRIAFYEKEDLEYIKQLLKDSFVDNNFLNSVLRSAKLQKFYNFRKDFEKALGEAFAEEGKLTRVNDVHAELLDLAFVYGKLRELKARFEKIAARLEIKNADIQLNPDLLFDQPNSHIATGAVLNLTERRLTRRFSLENIYEEAFFADVDFNRLKEVITLIFSILESEHSVSKENPHDIFIVCTKKQLDKIKKLLDNFQSEAEKLKTMKNIYIHVVENDEKPKTRGQILSIIR